MTRPDSNIEALKLVARRLGDLRGDVVFLGGATVGLLLTDPAAPPPRVTADVDVIVEVASTVDYLTRLAESLRSRGFVEDRSEDAQICRWVVEGVKVDVMPTDTRVLGFTNRWYPGALLQAVERSLDTELTIRMVTAPYFLATKLEAFRSRGAGDYLASHDIEDAVAVLDGRTAIEAEVATADQEVRTYLAMELRTFLETPAFRDALHGHLPGDPASQARYPLLMARIERLAVCPPA